MSLFSKSDRRGLLFLEYLAVGLLIVLWLMSNRREQPESDGKAGFSDTLQHRSSRKLQSGRTYTYAVPEIPVESFPFDPNTADSTTLLRLGLAPWQVQAIYNYRAKHGRYHTPEDFKRLPGMTLELWERLGKYVTIAEKYRYLKLPPRRSASSSASAPSSVPARGPQSLTSDTLSTRDTLSPIPVTVSDTVPRYPEKFRTPTRVDLNVVDTTTLKKIPDIGTYRARKIVEYRQRLGGFVRVEQVMEACEMPDEVLEWFTLNPVPLQTLDANQATVRQLMRHPYITFYQARALVEYRRQKGGFHSIDELLSVDKFTSDDVERLRPYLLFQ